MNSAGRQLFDPSTSKELILETVISSPLDTDQPTTYQTYREYCNEEIRLLRKGVSQEAWQSQSLAVKTYEDVAFVIAALRRSAGLCRPKIREALSSRFPTKSTTLIGLNHSINLGIRLWLMLNFQDRKYQTLRLEARCIDWDDQTTLQERVVALFPRARGEIKPSEGRLGPYFTAVFMTKVCGLELEWTTSLWDHLYLNRRKNTLRIFPYKHHLEKLIADTETQNKSPIPTNVLRETLLSLELLFPVWDSDTIALLAKEKQTFHDTGPFITETMTLTLSDFNHWRDRLLELHEVLQAPPVSWAQLWRDRRNPQQFWTFWIALFILLLTVFSFITGVIQAWASVKALNLALESSG